MERSAIIHLYLLVSLVVGVSVADGQPVDEVQLRPEEEEERRVVLDRFLPSIGQFQAARTIDRKDEAVSGSAALDERLRHWKSDRRKKRSAAAEIPISNANQQHPTSSSASQTFSTLNLTLLTPAEEDDASSSSEPTSETIEETTRGATEPHGLSTASIETATAATTTTSIPDEILEHVDEESEPIPELNDSPISKSNETVPEPHGNDPDSNTSTAEVDDSPEESSSVDKPTEIPVAPPTAAAVAVSVNRSASDDQHPAATLSTTRPSGRALSHEEEPLPWEAMSTKVIGTIIEDIQPFNNAAATAATALTTGAIAAIVMCLLLTVVATAGLSGYWWYRKRYMNRPETLSERYAPSETGIGSAGSGSSGFGGDDIFRVGYIHSPEMPRDSSEEMYSLDNDSFLTSLEAMTIPTYWTENIKHTKL